jgi:hypothetical protein
VLLIMLSARMGVRGGTTLVPSTPAVQADDASAATDRLHRQDAATIGAGAGRWGCRRHAGCSADSAGQRLIKVANTCDRQSKHGHTTPYCGHRPAFAIQHNFQL